MRILVIDSATEACSVALFEDNTLLAGEFRQLGRGHAEALVPMISDLPERGRAERIVVALGPGSFTGVRVGLAAARALGFAWGAEVQGYSTLELLAAMAREQAGAVPVAVAMTGGHGEWFVQMFASDGQCAAPLASLTPVAAAEACETELVAGTQAQALVSRRGRGVALTIWPDARSYLQLPSRAIVSNVRPLYGRAPDAKLPQARV